MKPLLSIIVTAHHEGLIAHKTMRSIERAVSLLRDSDISYEIIISIDRGDEETIRYFSNYTALPITIHQWDHGDLAQSRNSAITKVRGRFTAFIDADDLMSANWLRDGVQFLTAHSYGKYVAHSAYTIEFEGASAIVEKVGHTNKDRDTLLSVLSGRWNSVIIAPSTLLRQFPYTPNSPGYGYEDWFMSCQFIQHGVKNVLIPETAIFVRRKATGSEWARQKTSRSVLHAHPLFSPSHFRTIKLDSVATPASEQRRQTKNTIKELLIRSRIPLGLVKRPLAIIRRGRNVLKKKKSTPATEVLPAWLDAEWRALHHIEKLIFPPHPLPTVYHTITDDHYRVGLAYWQICRDLRNDTYDYVLFVPWLKRGGADLFTLNYANTAASLGKKVLVIATNEVDANYSEWRPRLNIDVDFVPFGTITRFFPIEQKYRLLEQLIENIHAPVLHILNSELAYDFVRDHAVYIKATGKKVIATSYSQSIDETGRVFGFSHSHLPQVYHLLAEITTDNEAVKSMWVNEYAYDADAITVHHQPLDSGAYTPITELAGQRRVLWASRLSPEKLPQLVAAIADLLPDDVHIDMYGDASSEFPTHKLPSHPQVHYRGGFNGVPSLPVDNYDAFLYTSLFDGMPNTPIEIALCGLPLVAARVGGVADFVGTYGQIVDDITNPKAYAEALTVVLDNPKTAFANAQSLRKQALRDFSQKRFLTEVRRMLKR